MMPVSSGMRFDTENSRCIPAERMTPEELRQLHRLAIERRPEACLGCGLEHNCFVYGHGCAVIRKALRLLGLPRCGRCRYWATVQCPLYGRNTPSDFCSRGERWRD